MNYRIPEKSKKSMPSLIRAVADRGATIPGYLSLGLGNPASEAIPVDIINEAMVDVMKEDPMKILQYGPAVGYEPLREFTKERLIKVKNLPDKGQELLMMCGSGQGLSLFPRTLCEEGDEVYTDQYSFTNALNGIRNSGAELVGIMMDEYGMIPKALEEKAKSGKGKYIYLIPNFQNPTGITMPLERRKKIYEIACKYDLLIYEDDPYGELRFAGEEVPAIKTFDSEDRVFYAGSYSKILSAGLRVGYLYGNSEVIKILQNAKNGSEGQSLPIVTQMILSKTIDRLDMAEHIKKLQKIYGRKCKVMIDKLRTTCAPDVKIYEPDGGMFVWLELPERINVDDFTEKCMQNAVGVVKSLGFAADYNHPGNCVRLNYTFLDDDKLSKAVETVGRMTRE